MGRPFPLQTPGALCISEELRGFCTFLSSPIKFVVVEAASEIKS